MLHPCAKRGVCVCLEGHFIQPHWGYYKRCKNFFQANPQKDACVQLYVASSTLFIYSHPSPFFVLALYVNFQSISSVPGCV